ncbi:MAG: NAD(P)-dependent oxidoreductase [Catonella sp.]|nr:NAD(P)-dependent oxidoreductase [Catonella sp.]
MNIVVTGATSMVGEAVIESAISHGDHVLAIVRHNSKKLYRLPDSNLIRIYEADLDEMSKVKNLSKKYDLFFHFGWGNTNRAFRDDPRLQEENIKYTLDAVDLAHRLGCEKFVLAGLQAEYGLKNELITEETRPEPIAAYGMAKLSAEMLSGKLCEKYGMKHIGLRIFSVYGPYDSDSTLVSYAVDSFLKGEKAEFSKAANIWNYIYSSDAGEMIYRLGSPDVDSGIYCVAGEKSTELKNYILQIVEYFDKEVLYSFSEESNFKPVNLCVDMSKTIGVTGYRPAVSFRDGIRNIIKYRSAKL